MNTVWQNDPWKKRNIGRRREASAAAVNMLGEARVLITGYIIALGLAIVLGLIA